MLIKYEDDNDNGRETIEHFDRVSFDPLTKTLWATRGKEFPIRIIFTSGHVVLYTDNNKYIKTYELNDTTCHDCKTSKKHQHELITEA